MKRFLISLILLSQVAAAQFGARSATGYYGIKSQNQTLVTDTFLLDNYPAATAYSLRKIKASSTNCIRVRRSSDNTEQDIGFVGGWIDTATLLTFVGAGDGFVRTFYDPMGVNNLNQTTTTAQPKIVISGALVTEAGKPAISFDGTDWMDATPGGWGFASLSIFYVASSTGSGQRIFDTRGTGSAGTVKGWQIKWNNSIVADISLFDNGAGTSMFTTGFTRSGHKNVSIFFTGTTLSEYTSGTLSDSVSSGTSIDITNSTIGRMGAAANNNTQAFVGKIQEFILFSSDQSANRTTIEANQMNAYGL